MHGGPFSVQGYTSTFFYISAAEVKVHCLYTVENTSFKDFSYVNRRWTICWWSEHTVPQFWTTCHGQQITLMFPKSDSAVVIQYHFYDNSWKYSVLLVRNMQLQESSNENLGQIFIFANAGLKMYYQQLHWVQPVEFFYILFKWGLHYGSKEFESDMKIPL